MAMTPEEEKALTEKGLKRLEVSYNMYETTKKETTRRMKAKLNPDGKKMYSKADIDREIDLITTAQQDVVDQYIALGGDPENLKKSTSKKAAVAASDNEIIAQAVADMMGEENKTKAQVANAVSETETRLEQEYVPKGGGFDAGASFDIINLPSKGEGYKDKIKKVSVSYLTAYDENMIVAPNLYRDNLILDYLLNAKLLSKEIDPMDLLEGDRDAIILFLRMNGYGNEYPITATDDATGKEFDTIIDLSKIKMKEFNLKGDSNGWFPFTLPDSGAEIKFRFPTHRDTVILDKLRVAEDNRARKSVIENYVSSLNTYIEAEKTMEADKKAKIRTAINTIESWADDIEEDEPIYSKQLTNRLNLLIMAVNGITDKEYISDFIKKMKVKDSAALRKYMAANEPGMDYNITVERPENLGGGSFTTFLQLDQFLFLNIPD